MGKFSTYRYLELKDDSASTPHITRSRALKQPRRMKKIFIFLIVLALFATYFLGLFAGQSQWLDSFAKILGYKNDYHHAVIIDAGSSGSRVLAYRFRVPFTLYGAAKLDLEDEFFEQSKPGLSSYADDPEKGADTIVQLIKKAEFLIPQDKRKSTPLLVRATAGLRLLPEEKARQLIESVRSAIFKLGYDVRPNAVEIMDGADEGIFIWYTVNLLHKIMDGETMAALDLGGGSTQITYQVSSQDDDVPEKQKYVVPADGNNITVFTHSYLGLGLNAARLGMFRLEANTDNATSFTSVCVEPIIQNEKWFYSNTEFTVSGAPRPANQKRSTSFTACRELVRRYVQRTLDWTPAQAPRRVAAMSFFYDVAADAGIIDVMKGGSVSIAQYRSHALRACSSANVEQPWACADLVYIVALLQDAYKIKDDEPVSLYKKVDGHEVSWALGLAYTTIMKQTQAAV